MRRVSFSVLMLYGAMAGFLLLVLCASPVSAAWVPSVPGAGNSLKAEAATTPAVQRRRRRRRRRGQRQPTPERIRVIQSALIREEYLQSKPTGRWDSATEEAMRRFQEENGFPVTGKPEALSLIKLGLGSETAGVGAPLPQRQSEGETSETEGGGKQQNSRTGDPDGSGN